MAEKRLAVAVPASFIADTPHLREKTSKVGLVGRACAIFRADEVVVYRDDPRTVQKKDVDLIASLLSYMETPQYLRKRMFKLEPKLQYAGILPPLRTPHHPLTRKPEDLKIGDYREGYVLSKSREGALVDIGFEEPALLAGRQFTVGKRVTVRVVSVGEPVEVALANRRDIPEYWGFAVSTSDSLTQLTARSEWDLRIATSKQGAAFAKVAKELSSKWKQAASILVVFGAPARGLYEIARDENARLDELVDSVVNTVPGQGTETVRTEEAVLASLAVFNVEFGF